MRDLRMIIGGLVDIVLTEGAKRATKFLAPERTVKATYQGRRDRRATRHTILVTIGRPNYRERQFIRACRRAGEPFPVKKVQIGNANA